MDGQQGSLTKQDYGLVEEPDPLEYLLTGKGKRECSGSIKTIIRKSSFDK